MAAPRWEFKYIGSSGTILFKPLKSGQCEFHKDIPFTVTDFEDYRQLTEQSRGQFELISDNMSEFEPKEEVEEVSKAKSPYVTQSISAPTKEDN